jgi:hypothetical protein
MKFISVFNFLQGLIIIMQALFTLYTRSTSFWLDIELSIYTNYAFILLSALMILSSVGLFLKKHFGIVLTLYASIILIIYGITTCLYSFIKGGLNMYSIPFVTVTQLIIFIYIFKRRSIFKQ